MFRPLALYIGLRYTRAKRRNHFVSFVAGTSMLGIALGVAVLITVLSVMNGFDEQIQHRFFAMAPQVTLTHYQGSVKNWSAIATQVTKMPGVEAAAPFASSQAMISYEGENQPLMLTGILSQWQRQVTHIDQFMVLGSIDKLTAESFSIVLGQGIARRIGADIGDKVTVFIPKFTVSIAGVDARMKRFTVVGIFKAGSGFGFDNQLGFINMHDAQTLLMLDDGVTGLRMRVKNIYAAPGIADEIAQQLPYGYQVTSWAQQFGAFFEAVKLEKTMMFLILMLLIAVAAFNLVSSLVMIVTDKQADIAILRTLGVMPRTVLAVFMVQGVVVGLIGTLLGLVGGLLLAYNATAIANWLQQVFNISVLANNIYFVDYVPSKIEMTDLWQVCGLALSMSFIATLYPAWRAARTLPAEALRYE